MPGKHNRLERQRLKKILNELDTKGFVAVAIKDEEKQVYTPPDRKGLLALAHDLETCNILCVNKTRDTHINLFIVWGNGPDDLIADFSAPNKELLAEAESLISKFYSWR